MEILKVTDLKKTYTSRFGGAQVQALLRKAAEGPFEPDESTIRKKLKEYAGLGILLAEKHGRLLSYRISGDGVELSSWAEAAAFFSEEAPCGVVGSYLLDRQAEIPEYFRYKRHYLLPAAVRKTICSIRSIRRSSMTRCAP